MLRVISASLLLCVALTGCSNADKDAVQARAESFTEALMAMPDQDEAIAVAAITPFLQPGDDRDAKVLAYVKDFKAKSVKMRITNQSIESIEIGNAGSSAVVTFLTAAALSGNKIIEANQATTWVKLDEQWYRTFEDAEKTLGKMR